MLHPACSDPCLLLLMQAATIFSGPFDSCCACPEPPGAATSSKDRGAAAGTSSKDRGAAVGATTMSNSLPVVRDGKIHMPPTSAFEDPALDSCCRKDARDTAARLERERVTLAESAKRGLSFAPHRAHLPAQTLGLNPFAGPFGLSTSATGEDADGDEGTDDEDEDLAFLEELDADGDEDELARLRKARVDQIKASSPKRLSGPLELVGFGRLNAIDQGALLELTKRADRVVAVLGLAGRPGTNEFLAEVSTGSTPADRASLVVIEHMRALAKDWAGTLFLRCAISSEDSPLLRAIRAERLPAVICFREGLIADKATHPHQIQQFASMGQIGYVVYEAWLHQSHMLLKTPAASAVARYRARAADAEAEAAELAVEAADDGWRVSAAPASAAAGDSAENVSDVRKASSQRMTPSAPIKPGAWAAAGCGCGDTSCDIEFTHEHLDDSAYPLGMPYLDYNPTTDGRKMPMLPAQLDTIASILEDGPNV